MMQEKILAGLVFVSFMLATIPAQATPTIRAYAATDADRNALRGLLKRVWDSVGREEWMFHMPRKDAASVVAFREQEMVGFATRYERDAHPYTTTVELATDPDRGGAAMLGLLHAQITSPLARERLLRTLVSERQTAELAYFSGAGFREVRRTWTPTVAVNSIPKKLYATAILQAQRKGYEIRSLREAMRANDPTFILRLTEAHRDHYLETHAVNPPKLRSLNEWQDVFFGKDSVPEATFVAIKGGQIAAYTSVRRVERALYEVAWFATTPDFRADSLILNQALKAKEFEYVRVKGAKRLYFELDSTDPQAMALLPTLPIDRGIPWITLQTGIPNP
jgi:hypothetical protein